MRTIKRKVELREFQKGTHQPKIELAFLLQDWDDAYNVGGMFRIADACGATELIMTGHTPIPPHPQIGVTSLGQHRRVHWRHIQAHAEACETLIEEGWTLVAVELATDAQNYMEYEYPERTCLVLGNEGKGVYQAVLKSCKAAVFIPMSGKGRSLNVHVAAAVVAFEALLG
ncbi:MAG: tRNA methyltransferase [Armatimonadetes bacterium]|nr:tRNA methyltransferase [Armatimonadota bacterium]